MTLRYILELTPAGEELVQSSEFNSNFYQGTEEEKILKDLANNNFTTFWQFFQDHNINTINRLLKEEIIKTAIDTDLITSADRMGISEIRDIVAKGKRLEE